MVELVVVIVIVFCWTQHRISVSPACERRQVRICVLISYRVNDAQSQPKREYTPKPRPSFDFGETQHSNGAYAPASASPPSYSPGKLTSRNSVILVQVSLNICVLWKAYSEEGMCTSESLSYDWHIFPSATLTSPSTISRSIFPKNLDQEQTAWVRQMKTCHLLRTRATH